MSDEWGYDPYNGRVGDVIEVNQYGSLRVYLVGDVNDLGGVCDDCQLLRHGKEARLLGNIFDDSAMVEVYKMRRAEKA